LAVTTGTGALAQHVDPSPYSQHPEQRSAPIDRNYGGESNNVGDSDMSRASDNQEQLRYSLSPPNGAD
jgi:hypothetical protein